MKEMDWRTITTTELHEAGIVVQGSTEGAWIMLGLGFVIMLVIAAAQRYV